MNLDKMKLIKGAFILTFGSVLSAFFFGLAGLIIARYLGPINYGIFNAGIALPSAFSLSFLIGIDDLMPREVARKPDNLGDLLISALYPIIVWITLLSIIIIVVGYLMGYSTEIYNVMVIALSIYVLRSFSLLIRSVMRGLECMAFDVLIQFSESLTAICLLLILLRISGSPLSAALAFSGSALLSVIIGGILIKPFIVQTYHFNKELAKKIILESIPLLIMATLIAITTRIDVLILSSTVTNYEVGLYSSALSVYFLVQPISASFSASLLPTLSSTYKNEQTKFTEVWINGLRFVIVLSIILFILSFVYADVIIKILFGEEYINAVPLLRILSLTIGIKSTVLYLTKVLISIYQQNLISIAFFSGLLITIVLSLSLVPFLGSRGVAWATVGREVFILALLIIFLQKKVPKVNIVKTLLLPLIAGLIVFTINLVFSGASIFSKLILLLFSVLIALIFLFISGFFSPKEVQILNSLVQKIITKKSK